MAVPTCSVCKDAHSKYKCPICEMRYCSISCYQSHKSAHTDSDTVKSIPINSQHRQPVSTDQPNTTQRPPKIDFTGFENDPDFKRLLARFPNLKYQLQLSYGVTLEPGPDEAHTWTQQDWLRGGHDGGRGVARGGRARGVRGRGRGGRFIPQTSQGGKLRGPWTQDKGDKQAMDMVHKMRGGDDDELAEGMDEFVQLCQLKFGLRT